MEMSGEQETTPNFLNTCEEAPDEVASVCDADEAQIDGYVMLSKALRCRHTIDADNEIVKSTTSVENMKHRCVPDSDAMPPEGSVQQLHLSQPRISEQKVAGYVPEDQLHPNTQEESHIRQQQPTLQTQQSDHVDISDGSSCNGSDSDEQLSTNGTSLYVHDPSVTSLASKLVFSFLKSQHKNKLGSVCKAFELKKTIKGRPLPKGAIVAGVYLELERRSHAAEKCIRDILKSVDKKACRDFN